MLVHLDDARIARELQAAENASMYKMYPNKFKFQEQYVEVNDMCMDGERVASELQDQENQGI
jgi:hypothetical protein